jgi:hypothetical protein
MALKPEEEAALEPILIAVVTSRRMLRSRVASIVKTWGHPDTLPSEVDILFFVGAMDDEESMPFDSGSTADRTLLAEQAGLERFSQIIVMSETHDDEYPPVYKNSAMMKHLERIVRATEKVRPSQKGPYKWIFRVDDDTYVNVDGLRTFVKSRGSPESLQIWGQPGFGRKKDKDAIQTAGLAKPYCMGGPGYIMSRAILREIALGIDDCVRSANSTSIRTRQHVWHSDVVIGMCAYKLTGVGCYEDEDYYLRRPFRQNYNTSNEDFVGDTDLAHVVSMHPFKESDSLMRQHQRYSKLRILNEMSLPDIAPIFA